VTQGETVPPALRSTDSGLKDCVNSWSFVAFVHQLLMHECHEYTRIENESFLFSAVRASAGRGRMPRNASNPFLAGGVA
jgi:hypothetical protein